MMAPPAGVVRVAPKGRASTTWEAGPEALERPLARTQSTTFDSGDLSMATGSGQVPRVLGGARRVDRTLSQSSGEAPAVRCAGDRLFWNTGRPVHAETTPARLAVLGLWDTLGRNRPAEVHAGDSPRLGRGTRATRSSGRCSSGPPRLEQPPGPAPSLASPRARPPPLPAGWEATRDPYLGEYYYWQVGDAERSLTWLRPANPLPEMWREAFDTVSGRSYYWRSGMDVPGGGQLVTWVRPSWRQPHCLAGLAAPRPRSDDGGVVVVFQ